MARLKEDSGSWKAGGVLRRDSKHTKIPDTKRGPSKRKPSRKKWCKGHKGVPHKLEPWVANKYEWSDTPYYTTVCTICGKQFMRYEKLNLK